MKRCVEHFRNVLNQPFTISDTAIDQQPQVETKAYLELLPSLQETIGAMQQLSCGKAPGLDAIPAEIEKHGGPNRCTSSQRFSRRCGTMNRCHNRPTLQTEGEPPTLRQQLRNLTAQHCQEIFVQIPLNCLRSHIEQGFLPKSQDSLHPHRGTTEMNYAARQFLEKYQEMPTHLYSTFVDLTKAFDMGNRE
ncbi:unnamed protein product [Schistocephalus solidus]|uniref:Reverse transcriptase domain-containing protein n=1 Tax=Schistocephalus solidus TaxID=70667 RepID=A0A183SGS1_SCHSO|nr:unnamed protein product [Schistocephalus solidus]